MRSMGRYFEGFLDIHPSYNGSCNICESDIATFFEIDAGQDLCLDCCDDIWFARAEMETANIIIEKWCSENKKNES